MKILIYARQTLRSGERCWKEEMEGSDDVVAYDGTPAEFRSLAAAARHSAKKARAGDDLYYRRLARTLATAAEAGQ